MKAQPARSRKCISINMGSACGGWIQASWNNLIFLLPVRVITNLSRQKNKNPEKGITRVAMGRGSAI